MLQSNLFFALVLILLSSFSLQAQNENKELETLKILEFGIKDILIDPLDITLKNREVKKANGSWGIRLLYDKGSVQDTNFKKHLKNFLDKETRLTNNINVIVEWESRNDVEGFYSNTYWLFYEDIVLNILLGEEEVSFLLVKKWW